MKPPFYDKYALLLSIIYNATIFPHPFLTCACADMPLPAISIRRSSGIHDAIDTIELRRQCSRILVHRIVAQTSLRRIDDTRPGTIIAGNVIIIQLAAAINGIAIRSYDIITGYERVDGTRAHGLSYPYTAGDGIA